jgi:hypothetical protein
MGFLPSSHRTRSMHSVKNLDLSLICGGRRAEYQESNILQENESDLETFSNRSLFMPSKYAFL